MMIRHAVNRIYNFDEWGFTMSDVKQSLQDKLQQLEKGLYLMSVDRVRALSVHETVELIEELRAVVAAAKADAGKL